MLTRCKPLSDDDMDDDSDGSDDDDDVDSHIAAMVCAGCNEAGLYKLKCVDP